MENFIFCADFRFTGKEERERVVEPFLYLKQEEFLYFFNKNQ